MAPAAILALAIVGSGPAAAGPPFVTDDPEPTDSGHWEIYNFVSATRAGGVTSGQAGLDINYGGAKDLQLTAVLPIDDLAGTRAGLGDIELAVKYRVLRQGPNPWIPEIAVFPRIVTPTAPRRLGGGEAGAFLPLWAQWSLGRWSLFGGGGYDLNPGLGHHGYWQSGLTLTRAVTGRLTLGVEVYHQTPDTLNGAPFTGLNAGAIYRLSKYWSLLAAAGPGVQNSRREGLYDVYLALEATY
jgi:hypothetical protein